ncbi:hypothetical protein BS47DRAFT_149415 [Hydnum rufescens UP504]|uniref:AAA+ ATPase domain-containing protein n=1 Tax=Hydnum rufescens UP504 TaxID=1448309 RepID=A0A9P6APV9_9AGAM|nr:hypothetical protein BS47DRAFT_149415 [Hydnum rufescens UP504]
MILLGQPKLILQKHTQHQALSRLQSSPSIFSQSPLPSQGSYDQEQWIDKYRPTRASEVLGNDINARYIKEWLSALELDMDTQSSESQTIKPATFSSASQKIKSRGTKRARPVIVRAVDKPKKKRRKDWIVDSDDEDEIYEEMKSDDVALSDLENRASSEGTNLDVDDNSPNSRVPPSQVPTSSLHQFDFSTRLTNVLLITGPPGTGKTSAVYACAAELGWSVFEANPGSGKRTSALLSSIFDGVGKNHTLGLDPVAPNAGKEKQSHQSGGLDAFFGAREKPRKNIPHSDVGTAADPINLDSDDSPSRAKKTALGISEPFHSKGSGPRNINQSIILLEEVDILFQNEGGFWPAVVHLIKESRRPVIMTCNDVSLVPVQELPLQTILGFEPCPVPLAASYLCRLSQLEGYKIEQRVLEQLYGTVQGRLLVDFPDQPMHPVPTHSNPVPDLRQAIQQMQILCRTTKPPIIEACNSQSFETLADWSHSRPVSLSDPDPLVARLQETGAVDDAITLRFLWKFADSVSYANCVDRRLGDYAEAQLIDDYNVWDDGGLEHDNTHKASLDNLLGHTILHKPAPRETAPTVPFYARDEEIALEIVRAAHRRGALYPLATCSQQDSFSTSPGCFDSIRLFDDRAQHQSRVLKFIEGLVQLSSPLLPRPEIFVDYIPYVRQMVVADDAEKEAEAQALAALQESARVKGNMARMTRNSQRSAEGTSKLARRHDFIRYISLRDDELRALYESAFSNF